MAILTATEIKKQLEEKHITIDGYNESRVQPNSYDLTLGKKIQYYSLTDYRTIIAHTNRDSIFETYGMLTLEDPDDTTKANYTRAIPVLDTKKDNSMIATEIPEEGFLLLPRILYLVETEETVWSDKYVMEVSGVSSLARLGIGVHKTAGYSNLNHKFKWVLEVEVTHAVVVYPGMKFAQVYFHTTEGDTSVGYTGKYKDAQLDDNICGSKSYMDEEQHVQHNDEETTEATPEVETDAIQADCETSQDEITNDTPDVVEESTNEETIPEVSDVSLDSVMSDSRMMVELENGEVIPFDPSAFGVNIDAMGTLDNASVPGEVMNDTAAETTVPDPSFDGYSFFPEEKEETPLKPADGIDDIPAEYEKIVPFEPGK